eukprot:TRINITY_DN4895_c0_g1_i1.p1 TRINITY_DN4895_c0_g1~~TRINITY_DN4895_c0_g1_i1.p1  ORF type:complete len:115 (+),score=17.91 TRINITY_DN4895_c0_g1_i1:549-893(+)
MISNIDDSNALLGAEALPLDQLESELYSTTEKRLVQVFHFTKLCFKDSIVITHGYPFFMLIHKGEKVQQIKTRILRLLGCTKKETNDWMWAWLFFEKAHYLENESHFQISTKRK